MKLLQIKDLSCGYDSIFNFGIQKKIEFVLKDINLIINKGEIVGIIGPNGAGKTTLIRAISRTLKPKKGEIFFDGKNIWKMNFRESARQIAVVPQNFSGLDMTVEEFVLLGRIPHIKKFQFFETKKDLQVAQNCMELTDVLKLKDQLISKISGGERQLALIAKALTQQPRLLLLDEPSLYLDITHQVRILDLIKRLNKEFELTVVMVLHELNLASEYCERLVLLNEGKIYKTGSPQEVLDYHIIKEVYKTEVLVEKNPFSSKPYILLVSQKREVPNEKRIDTDLYR
ncbi:MAG: ABC transporter ATP-binding protein [Candidatus Omnitrophica bacterium]|nr:ABC transporter ATP-binding protein [Candidatus Omnitrophota bacterium]